VLIIDDEIVVTGSFNFSDSANDRNDENVVVLFNRDVAAQYLREFDRRWAEAREPDAQDLNCN
jgi:phosphatidylserine/phosphatidylglycerophosphate/cardiolipin synthase-like enzyme